MLLVEQLVRPPRQALQRWCGSFESSLSDVGGSRFPLGSDESRGNRANPVGAQPRSVTVVLGWRAAVEAGADQIVVLGPSRIADLAVHEIDLALDALQRGDRRIVLDEDGDPQLI